MANHKSDINVGIKFNADTSQAQQQIQALQASLNKIGKMTSLNKTPLTADLTKAIALSQELNLTLNKSLDVNTNKLDLSKLNKNLVDSGKTLRDYGNALKALGPEGQKAFMALATSVISAEAPLKRSNKLIESLWSTLKNTARWEISSKVLHGFERALSGAYSYAQNLNKSLTDIRIVTGYSADRMADFAVEANKAARALSATTKEYADASLIYFQQGLNDQQVKERTDITIKMANVTRESAQTVSDQMTAVWNNFDDGSKALEYYSDVLTALGAATASSTAEITEGLEKFAAVAGTVGLSYEYSAAALATLTSNTRQSASEVGTALKTLFSRIQGLSLGETLDDGTDLNKYSEALNKVGISIKDQNGQLKAMDNLLNEMASKWETLNNDQQVALAQTVAGVRQYTQLIALMENWSGSDNDNMMANLKTASRAEGALQKQTDIYAESWEAARDRVTAALEEIYNKILDSEFFIKLTNVFADFIDIISVTIDNLGGLEGVLLSLGAIFTNVFRKNISASFKDVAYSLKMLTKSGRESETKLRKEAVGELQSFNQRGTLTGETRTDSYQIVAKMQENYLQNEEKLSDLNKEINLALIERAKLLAESNVKIAENLEKTSRKEKVYENNFNLKYLKNKSEIDSNNFKEEREKYKNYIRENANNEAALNILLKGGTLVQNEEDIENLRKKVDNLKRSFGLLDLEGDELKKSLNEIFSNSSVTPHLLNLFEALSDGEPDIKKINQEFENFEKGQENFSQAVQKKADAINELFLQCFDGDQEKAAKALEEMTSLYEELAYGQLQLKQGQQGLEETHKYQIKKNKEAESTPIDALDGFTQSISGVLSVISIMTTLDNTIKMLGDSSISAKDKIFSLLSTTTMLGMEIPGLIKSFQGVVTIMGKTMSMAKLTGIIGGITLAIAALTLAISYLHNKWKESTPEYQLEKITEESEKATEKANAAEEAYKSLKETIEGYDSAVKSLEDLTEGTEEFKAAIEEANEKARELIDTYNITKGVSIDKNGLIVIDENILKEKQQNYFDTSKATTGSEYILKEEQKELTVEVDNKELINNFIKDNKIYGNSETAKEVYADPEKLNQLIGALQNLEDSTTENDETAKILIATLFNQDKNSIEFSKNLDSLLSASSAKLISLADQLGLNTNALLSNTDALVFAANMLQGNETYENSEYKNTLALAYDEAYKDAFENSEIDTFSEAQEALGVGKVVSNGQTIEEDGKTLKTYNYNGGVYTQAEIIDLAKSIEANAAAVIAVENKQSHLETLSPTAAQITEITNSGYASTGSYNKDLEIYNYAKSNNQYGTYEDFLKNFNPYEDIENKIAEDFEGKDISTIINGEILGEGDTTNVIKNWWAGLSDEDKTVTLNIEYDKGQWQEQLNALKAESVYTETAGQTGYSEEAVKSYTQSLMATNEAYKENEYMASLAAQQQLNFAKGVSDASQILEDNKDILNKADENSMEYHEALGKLNIALEQMFGTKFSYEYLKDNFDTVKDAVNGDTEAIQILREEASKQILIDIGVDSKQAEKKISDLYKQLSSLDIGEPVGDEFLEMFNQLIEEAELTKEEVEDILNSMGLAGEIEMVEPVIEPKLNLEQAKGQWQVIDGELTETKSVPIRYEEENPMETTTVEGETEQGMTTDSTGTMTLTPPEGSGQQAIEYQVESHITTKTSGETNLLVPTLKDAKVVNNKQSLGKVGNANTPPGSGGGGGSNAEPLEYEDEIERYHENTRALERLERALDKVTTAKDRAFGKHRLALIDDEIEATEALVQQQRALLAETREYLKQDFAEIQQYGFTYDEFGELTNYDEVMKEQIDKYNAVVATGNADAIEAAKKEYEEFKENMEQYEETLTQYEEAQAQLQEYINQVVDLKLEKITTEVEIKILVNDKELTRLEYLLRKVEYEGKGAADAIALMGRQFEQISEKAKPIQEAIDKIYEQARAEGRGLLEEEVREIKSFYEDGVISSEEEKRIKEIYDKAASEDRMLTQAEEEQIQEYKEQLLELNEEVMDIVETIEGKFIETLEELNGKVDESIGRFATYTGMFQTLSDVITLSGKAGSKYGMDMLNTLSARTVANASTAMRSNLRSYEALDQIYKEEQANLERAIRTGDERLIKQYQDRLHEVEMMRETSYESMLTSWTEALQAANDLFDTKLTNMITSLKQNLGDIDKLVEIYDRAVELEDLYISGNKSIYELSKLARDVGKDIDKTANIIAKNKLVSLLDQINKMRAEGVKLSQYDLEYWQAKYELELAEIALQEAQEAKAQVKLTRNTAGGWGYTYVADAEAISEAQQNYEDSLYNMQELHDEYIKDYSERLIKNRQELVNALQDLDKTSLTFEEDALRFKEHHFKQEEYLIDELNKAYQRAGVSYQDTLLAQTYGGASLEDSHSNFINSVVKMIQDELLPGYQEFQESVDGINSQAGTTVEDAMDKIFESSITMENEVIKNINDLTSGVKEVSDEIWNFQETYGEAISKMLADNEDYYSKTIKMYQNFMAETEADKWLQYFDDMRGPGEVLGLAGSGANGAMAGNGFTAVTNGTFSSMMNIGKTPEREKKNNSSAKNREGNVAYVSPTGRYSTKPGVWEWHANEDADEAKEKLKEQGYNVKDVPSVGAGMTQDRKDKGIDDTIDPKDPVWGYATGGYTGSWGAEGRLAILHEKELVLNKYDTENMLDMVNTLRDIDWRAKLSELWTNIEEHFIAPIFGGGDNLQQDVRIEASFPGVSNHTEIEEAFNNLINTASQYANRKRY